MIYVDPLAAHGWKFYGACVKSCHMWTTGDVEELHAFAVSIGLKRVWFQDKPSKIHEGWVFGHYDLTTTRRAIAIAKGARAVSRRVAVEIWRKMREKAAAAAPPDMVQIPKEELPF